MGEGDVKNSEKFADIVYGWSLARWSVPCKKFPIFFFFTKLLALCAFYSEGQLLNGKITLLYGGNTYRVSSQLFIVTNLISYPS